MAHLSLCGLTARVRNASGLAMLGLLLCHQRSFKLQAVVLPCCSVFTCKLQSKTLDQYGTSHVRTSRLHLVDLAGE